MPHQPRIVEERYVDIQERLAGETPELTSFAPNSIEHALCMMFAEEWVRQDYRTLASQLSGWIDYAGGPVGEDELLDLNLDVNRINIPRLNSLLFDEDLDAKAAENGVERIPGSFSKGRVTFGTVVPKIEIPAGTIVATERQDTNTGSYASLEFRTTQTVVSPEGETSISAPIQALIVGTDHNVGAGRITQTPRNPPGIEGVTNSQPTSGGEGPETNAELRERAKNAATESSGGGTAAGMRGAVVDGIEGIEADDVQSIELSAPVDTDYLNNALGLTLTDTLSSISSPSNGDPVVVSGDSTDPRGVYFYDSDAADWHGPLAGASYVQLVVDGGTDTDVQDVIDASKPAGIAAELVRPTPLTVDIEVSVVARYDVADIDTERIGDTLTGYLSDLGLGEDVYQAQLIEHIMDSDEDVVNVDSLTVTVNDSVDADSEVPVATDEVARAGTVNVTVSGALETSG